MEWLIVLKNIYLIFYKIVNYSLILSFFYILYTFKNENLKDTIKKYKQNDFSQSKNRPIELIMYIITRDKSFLLFFIFYFIIFKKIGVILLMMLVSYHIMWLLPKLLKKDVIIENTEFSLDILKELSTYCTFGKIFKYIFKTISRYCNIKTFDIAYKIIKKKKSGIAILEIIEIMIISKILGISYKYLVFISNIVNTIGEENIKLSEKRIKIKIISILKMILKTPLIVILEWNIIPLELENVDKKIIKEKWKIRTNPIKPNPFMEIARIGIYSRWYIYEHKYLYQNTAKIHQALYIPSQAIHLLFTRSSMTDNCKNDLFCSYDQDSKSIQQFFRIKTEEEINEMNIEIIRNGVLQNFYINHMLSNTNNYHWFMMKSMLEIEIYNEKKKINNLIHKMQLIENNIEINKSDKSIELEILKRELKNSEKKFSEYNKSKYLSPSELSKKMIEDKKLFKLFKEENDAFNKNIKMQNRKNTSDDDSMQ